MTINDAVLYTRVSSDEQKKKGYSLDYQRKKGEEYAKEKNLNLIKIYSENYSGRKIDRPLFREMIELVQKKKIKNLIFLVHHRASRNGVDSAQLVHMAEHLGFNIHLIEDGLILNKHSKPTDYLIFEVSNCMANFYPRNLSVDVTSKLREKAEQGYYPERPPVGYMRKPKCKRAYLQINPDKAPFIKRAFELYSTGNYSYKTLAKQLRDEGFMISDAVKCGKSNIEDILNNPVYMGDFIFKGKRYFNAKHEPIVSRELYTICQNIIKSRTSGKSSKHDFVFSNLIKCSKCGCYMVGEIKKGKYIYYHCTGNRGGSCKKGSYIREEKIEEAILGTLKSFHIMNKDVLELCKKCFKYEIENQNFYSEERLKKLDDEIKKMNERLNRLFNLFLDEKIDEELYKKKSDEIESTLNDLILSRTAVSKTGIELIRYSENLFELFKNASRLYFYLDNSKRRELLKLLCSNFSYNGENIEITIKKAFQPLVKIAYLEKMGPEGFEPATKGL